MKYTTLLGRSKPVILSNEQVNNIINGVQVAFIIPVTNKDVYNPLTGTIEPGTSWLAVLSMTGIIGFILFLSIFITCFKQSLSNQYSIQLTGLLAFFAVHLLVEGYVFAASNHVCYMFWLILGCSFDYKNHKDDNYEFGILLK